MRKLKRFQPFQVATAAVVALPLILSPPAMALPFGNCDQAEAAGAAPFSPANPATAPISIPTAMAWHVNKAQAPQSPVRPVIPRAAGQYTTTIVWSGAPCIEAVVPNFNETLHQNLCDADTSARLYHTAAPGLLVGADPIMGEARSIACSVIRPYDGAIWSKASPSQVTATT